jgi:hypothetical protein
MTQTAIVDWQPSHLQKSDKQTLLLFLFGVMKTVYEEDKSEEDKSDSDDEEDWEDEE